MENKNIPNTFKQPKKSLFHYIWNKIALTVLFIAFVVISPLIFLILISPFLPIYAIFKYYIFSFLGEDIAKYGASAAAFFTAWEVYGRTSWGNKIINPIINNWKFEKIVDMFHLDIN